MRTRVLVHRDAESLVQGVAKLFLRSGLDAVRERGVFAVVLSGGSTPRPLYRRLAGEPLRGEAPWDRTHLFWGDERTVPPDHWESNYRSAMEELIAPLGLDPARVHRMEGEIEPEDAAARYEAGLRLFFGERSADPVFDLVLLGIGEDGHTASLFPGTAAVGETCRWVVANEVPRLGVVRLTLTAPLMNTARRILFLVSGAGKAGILREVLDGPRDPLRLPAQLIAPDSGELICCADPDAAALLSGGSSYTLEQADG